MQDASPGPFVLRVAAWLPLAFLVWYLAGPVLAWPIALLTEGVARLGFFRDLIQGVEQQGHLLTIVSTLKPALATPQQSASGVISVEVNTLLYSFGLPMLAALILAARQPHPLRKLLLGYAVLAPLVVWGLLAEFLKRIAFDTAPSVAGQTGFGPLQREAIAFAYQFGSLILPTVAPAVFWVLTHRRFVEGFRGRSGGPTDAP
ncbi:MAG TPA: exosortase H-associated membrane protein [Casimicrobiaceae bacterium]|nr:exosortase H-associated membrane protein [Casimicrobiaceae bacterium]